MKNQSQVFYRNWFPTSKLVELRGCSHPIFSIPTNRRKFLFPNGCAFLFSENSPQGMRKISQAKTILLSHNLVVHGKYNIVIQNILLEILLLVNEKSFTGARDCHIKMFFTHCSWIKNNNIIKF